MANFYSNLASVASRLLSSYGQSVTFSRETSTGFDPVTGTDTTTASSFSGNGAIFAYNANEVDGEVVQSTDMRLMLEAVDTTPLIGDTCTVDSTDYRVMFVRETSPAGTVTHYELQLRK